MEGSQGFEVQTVSTAPIAGQATGTSGLRKKVKVFQSENYLHNWIQSLFNTLQDLGKLKGAVLVLGGDGRYWNKEAMQIIIKIAAANEVSKLYIGKDGIISTPAVSAIVRNRKTTGAIILTASHNPGGPDADFGIKYNIENGGPAPEKITNGILAHTEKINSYKIANIPELSLGEIGKVFTFGSFSVEIIDPVTEYLDLLQRFFDFDALKHFISSRKEFKVKIDAMHGVTGGYVNHIFGTVLGIPAESLLHAVPSEDFNGGHPDPNLTYAEALVKEMYSGEYDFGAAFDGDGDRNMILGKKFFVTPSDSVAIIADHAHVIPYFSGGLNAVARSMPTGAALDRVAKAKGINFYEVPTGWKFFGNIMDHYGKSVICGEESFGTGADHIREKDGIWAVLAWLSILAHHNKTEGAPFVSVEDIVKNHWKVYGRNFFARYDYEEVASEGAKAMMAQIAALMKDHQSPETRKKLETDEYKLESCDDFEYHDTFDGSTSSHQGYRFVYNGGSRLIFRLSGTGSSGATIRVYVERYEADLEKQHADTLVALKGLIDLGLSFSELQRFTGRDKPTVIT